jgi:hypothetical protein
MLPRTFLFAVCSCASAVAQSPDTTFFQESATFFTHAEGFTQSAGLPSDNVLAITVDASGQPIASTDQGIVKFNGESWDALPSPGFVATQLTAGQSRVFAAGSGQVAVLQGDHWTVLHQTAAPVSSIACVAKSDTLLVATKNRLWSLAPASSGGASIRQIVNAPNEILSVAGDSDGAIAVGTQHGLFVKVRGSRQWIIQFPQDAKYRWAPREVVAVTYDQQGRLCFGAQQGAGLRDASGNWELFTGAEGLPWNHFVMVTSGSDGEFWFATDRGAIRRDDERFRYRFSLRWTPDDQINDIAVGDNGTVWLATANGIGRIERRASTLKEKAEQFTQQVEERHVRDGFVATSQLKEAYNPASFMNGITDNDGLYTSMYGAAKAFDFAATGDPEARRLARRSFEACKQLVDITGNGFVARVIIPVDWHEDVNEQYNDEYNRQKKERDPHWKLITPRFPLSKDGKYRYKIDTSSDELAGHYFFYPIYYDLVAETEEEKEEVRSVMKSMTDHLIDNGFMLRDHDGEPTRWGDFSPEYLNSMRGWAQRGLNSMMMLSFLRAAEHVTGDAKYAKVFDELCADHKYDFLAMKSKTYFPPEDVVPWDNNLCLMSWYNLLRYEQDPERVIAWRLSMEHAWLHISKQKSAFWNFLYKACAEHVEELAKTDFFNGAYPELPTYAEHTVAHFRSSEAHMQDSMEMLRNMPLSLINVTMDNTHRLDIQFDNTPGSQETWVDRRGQYGWHYDGRALPIDERGHVRIDRDAFDLRLHEGRGDGRHEQEGTFYLLPYYLGLYHGFIQ